MTKFCGDAIGVRSGRAKSTYTGKDLKKNMEKFLATGVHPELERAKQESTSLVVPLPDLDVTRPFVFLDLSIDNKPAGRLVVELYEDLAPAAALHFKSRCLPGSSAGLKGSTFHKLLPHYGIFGCRSAAAAVPGGGRIAKHGRLQHVEPGAVSVSLDGTEVALALGRSLNMDKTHQVVGRVHRGREVLEQLSDLPTGPDDSPYARVTISKCGVTNAAGNHESLEEVLAKETPEEAAARMKQESRETKNAVLEALREGMAGQKRKAEDEPSTSQPATAAAEGTAVGRGGGGEPSTSRAVAGEASKGGVGAGGGGGEVRARVAAVTAGGSSGVRKPAVRQKMLDSLLGDISEGSSNDSEGE